MASFRLTLSPSTKKNMLKEDDTLRNVENCVMANSSTSPACYNTRRSYHESFHRSNFQISKMTLWPTNSIGLSRQTRNGSIGILKYCSRLAVEHTAIGGGGWFKNGLVQE